MFDEEQTGHEFFKHPYEKRTAKNKNHNSFLPPIRFVPKNLSVLQKLDKKVNKKQEKTIFYPANFSSGPPSQKRENKDSFYFKLKVVSKVGMFIQKLKRNITMSIPDFRHKQMCYVENKTQSDPDGYLIESDSIYLIWFEIIVLLASIVSMWNATFLLVFQNSPLPHSFSIVIIILTALEIVINFNTQTYDNNFQIINNRKLIAKEYISKNFPYDIVSLIALIICLLLDVSNESKFAFLAKVLVLLRSKSYLRITQKLSNIYGTSTDSSALISIIKLLFKLLTFIHFLSIILNLFSQLEKLNGVSETWVDKYQTGSITSDVDHYLLGWYWGSTILTTVGFGDIVPANINEAFFISLVQVGCCAIFGYCINYIGSMINVLGEAEKIYQQELRKMNNFLRDSNISTKIKNKIKTNLYYRTLMKQLYDPEAEAQIIKSISAPIRQELISTTNKTILKKSTFFNRFSDQIIKKLSLKLIKATYIPEQPIYSKGQKNIKISIIQQGQICDYHNSEITADSKSITQYDNVNPLVGFINFITGDAYHTYGRSKAFTLAYQLTRQDFLKVLLNYRSDYMKFCETRDKMIQQGKKYVNRCLACMKFTHNTLQCPKIHYISPGALISKIKQLKRYKQNKSVRRFVSRKAEKMNSRIIQSSYFEEDEVYSQKYQRSGKRLSVKMSPRNLKRISRKLSRLPSINVEQIQQNQQYMTSEQEWKEQLTEEEQLNLNFDVCKFKHADQYFIHNHYKQVLNRFKTHQHSK